MKPTFKSASRKFGQKTVFEMSTSAFRNEFVFRSTESGQKIEFPNNNSPNVVMITSIYRTCMIANIISAILHHDHWRLYDCGKLLVIVTGMKITGNSVKHDRVGTLTNSVLNSHKKSKLPKFERSRRKIQIYYVTYL